MNCLEILLEFVAVQHEIILTGLPEADIHIAVFHSDYTLFQGLSKAIRTLTGQKILDFGIFFGSQFFVKLNSDKSGYLMDKDNIIYFYSDELQAAVESLNSYACDSSGKEIRFFFIYAKRTMILSCEDALQKLTA